MIPTVEQVLNAIEKNTPASSDAIRMEIQKEIGPKQFIEALTVTMLSMINDSLIYGCNYRYLLTEKGEELFTANYMAAHPECYPQDIITSPDELRAVLVKKSETIKEIQKENDPFTPYGACGWDSEEDAAEEKAMANPMNKADTMYDFGTEYSATYYNFCPSCESKVEVSTQQDHTSQYSASVFVRCKCGVSVPFRLPVN